MQPSIRISTPNGRLAYVFGHKAMYEAHHAQKPAIYLPLEIVAQISGWLDTGSDLTNMALVQRSWCYPAQAELFSTVILKCPIRIQLFVEAFVRNIGPGNPLWNLRIGRLHLESFVRHIYVDIPENYSQARFYANLITILPLLGNLRSIFIVMRRWENHIWQIELGKLLPEHAPPSLERLCIQVSRYCNVKMMSY
jgi:hypothetical protein